MNFLPKQKKPRYFHVGQKVYTPWGEGVVKNVHIDNALLFPVAISIDSDKEIYCTFDGRLLKGCPICISASPLPEIINTPLPEITDGLKEGDAVWVRNFIDRDWSIRIFKEYSNYVCRPYNCYADGHLGCAQTVWIYCEKYDTATIENYRIK